MSLNLAPLYESMVRQFSTTTGDGRFKQDFVAAANLALDELSNSAKLATPIEHVEATDEIIDELDAEQSYLVNAGLLLHLVNMGLKHVRGDVAFAAASVMWEDGKGDYMVMESRAKQSAVDDDGVPTSDIVGLGYID